MATETQRAKDQAKAQLESILEMVRALETDDEAAREAAIETITEDPLSVEVRSDWHSPGASEGEAEYKILLCTGGPAVQVVGTLGDFAQPDSASLEYQDWFTPWERLPATQEEDDALLTYAQQFYFGS